MHVVSACPLPVGSMLWQPQPSAWSLTVVCRATIILRPGDSVLADHHEDVVEHDDHWDDDPGRSLRAASDLVPVKPRADVTLVGHAFAADRVPVRSLVAAVLLGELSKGIEVVADRWVDQEGVLNEGPRFTRMPLVYERASGGQGTSNPVGVAGVPNRFGRIALPNLQPPGLLVRSLDDYVAPVGFGPIAAGWPARRERLGRAAVSGTPPDLDRPLPDDLDPQYWNHAPRDQQVQMIRDRERLILENLHPDHRRLVTDLPSVRPVAAVERRGRSEPVLLRCDTLWIDTDRGLCTLTWRGQVPLQHPDEQGRVVFTLDGPGQTAPRIEPLVDSIMLRPLDPDGDTAVPSQTSQLLLAADNVLPFTASPKGPRPALEDRPSAIGLPFAPSAVPAPRASSPSLPAPYALSPPAIPPPAPLPPAVPPPAPQAPAVPMPMAITPPPSPRASQPSIDPPPRSLWSVPDAGPGAVAPLTVGQLAAVPAKPIIPSPRASVPAPSPSQAGSTTPATAPAASSSAGEATTAATPAAAAAAEARAARSSEMAPAPGEGTRVAPRPATEPKPEGKRALQLVSFEPEAPSRIRRKPAFQTILAALEERPLDSDLDDPALARDPAPVEDRRDVFEILARGDAADEIGLEDALDRAVRDDGKFAPPLLLLAGELRLTFDDVAALRATISLATPFSAGDEALKLAISDARDLLATPDLLSPGGLAERFSARIHEAFRKSRRQVAPTYLEDQVERALLEKRLYHRREVFGASHIRALLTLANPWVTGTSGREPGHPQTPAGPPPKTPPEPARAWPLYVSEAMARKLPMFVRFASRTLVEAHLQEDQFENHPNALRAMALARVVTLAPKSDKQAKPAAS